LQQSFSFFLKNSSFCVSGGKNKGNFEHLTMLVAQNRIIFFFTTKKQGFAPLLYLKQDEFMSMRPQIGLIGWRGMVGSVLLQRMEEEGDQNLGDFQLFSASLKGTENKTVDWAAPTIGDPENINALLEKNYILTCAGSSYSERILPELRKKGWEGYWIDAASAFRMKDHAILALDPLNKEQILQGLKAGKKDLIGCNCTVSLLLLSIAGLLNQGLVEWVSTQTYQAASGAGARQMLELVEQYRSMLSQTDPLRELSPLQLEEMLRKKYEEGELPTEKLGGLLAFNLLPWIDIPVDPLGQSREEWKAEVEANKILDPTSPLAIDGNCVRVSSLRCHSQAMTIKLTQALEIDEIEEILKRSHPWLRLIPNDRASTLQHLHPMAVSGKLDIHIGRLRHLSMGREYINLFSVGDQLLWGAAEPLRRVLNIVHEWSETDSA